MATNSQGNPFNITKAVDFSDEEISNYWVDIPTGGGFLEMAKPTSPMPMLILGGKGSGKTHLMRRLSYPVRRLDRPDRPLDVVAADGFLGIYMRCGGLNSARFSGKGQTDEAWAEVFAYYMELWCSRRSRYLCVGLGGCRWPRRGPDGRHASGPMRFPRGPPTRSRRIRQQLRYHTTDGRPHSDKQGSPDLRRPSDSGGTTFLSQRLPLRLSGRRI